MMTLTKMESSNISNLTLSKNMSTWEDTFTGQVSSDSTYYCVSVILSILSIVGVVMNTLNVITFRKFVSLRSSTNIMVEALTWCDLVMASLGNSMVAVSAAYRRWVFGRTASVVYGFLATFLGLSSIHLLTAISIDRYIAIVHPILKVRVTRRTTIKQVIGCFMLAFFWSLMPLLGWNYYCLEGLHISSSVNWVVHNHAERTYICLLFLFCFFLPITVITVTYFIITFVVRHVSKQLRIHDKEFHSKRRERQLEIRMAKTMFCVICSFVISWAPYAVVSLLTAFGHPVLTGHVVGTIPAIMAKTAVVWNPILYAFTNSQFKACLTQLVSGSRKPAVEQEARKTQANRHAGNESRLGHPPLLKAKQRVAVLALPGCLESAPSDTGVLLPADRSPTSYPVQELLQEDGSSTLSFGEVPSSGISRREIAPPNTNNGQVIELRRATLENGRPTGSTL